MEVAVSIDLTPKAGAFIKELEALCIKHGIQLTTSGYDSLQLWPYDPKEWPVYVSAIEDCTRKKKPANAAGA